MLSFARLRLLLIVLLALLGIASAAVPVVVRHSEDMLDRTTRHDVAWTGERGRVEFLTFQRRVFGYVATASAADRDQLDIDWQILQARMETWSAGSFAAFVRASPDRVALLDAISATLARIDPLLARIDDPATRPELIAQMEGLDELYERIGNAAYLQSSEAIAATRVQLQRLQWVQQLLIVALIIVSVLLVALLFGQNRLLHRSNARQKALTEQYAFLANHDGLTGLPNRARFREALDAACDIADSECRIALLAIDLDGFKPINDTLGHGTGDALLVSVGQRLERAILHMPAAVASRFGGDEFMVLLGFVPDEETAMASGRRILEAICEPHLVDQHRVVINASIGIALSFGQVSALDMLNRADLALHRAKGSGKGVISLYQPGLDIDIAKRKRIEGELAEAVLRGEFVPFYQPIIELSSRRVVGVETLARWRHPTRGLVPPAEFIPIAESTGRIVEIGRSILLQACQDGMRMPAPLGISVNLSPVQMMRSEIAAVIDEVLGETGLPPGRLKLEITEGVMMNDERRSRAMIEALRARGVAVSLDDFGTGYSSLSYLRGFGFDELKIDRSFISSLEDTQQSQMIVQTIVALGRTLGLQVVAEGIETDAQVALAIAAGCTQGQGYLFGKPMPFEDLVPKLGVSPTKAA